MDSDPWNARFSTSSRRYQLRSDLYRHEENEGDESLKAEFLCPFCAEDFDVVGLCCHIGEEHPVEAKNGVCPVCTKRVGSDLVGHVTLQHDHVQRRRKFRKNGSSLTFSLLRKELREGYLQTLLGASSLSLSGNAEPDPLLSSFMYNSNSSPINQPVSIESHDVSTMKESSHRNVHQPDKEEEETVRKSEFVLGLLFSTILDEL